MSKSDRELLIFLAVFAAWLVYLFQPISLFASDVSSHAVMAMGGGVVGDVPTIGVFDILWCVWKGVQLLFWSVIILLSLVFLLGLTWLIQRIFGGFSVVFSGVSGLFKKSDQPASGGVVLANGENLNAVLNEFEERISDLEAFAVEGGNGQV